MDAFEFLATTAQIGAAFAGFSGVAGVLDRRPAREHPGVVHHRFRVLVEISLLVVVFSLLPMLLSLFGLAEPLNWRVSSGLFSLFWFGLFFAGLPRILGLIRAGLVEIHGARSLRIAWYVITTVGGGLPLSNAAGAFPQHAAAVYCAGLTLVLGIGAVTFAQHFLGVAPKREP